jgi:hypothetical protein
MSTRRILLIFAVVLASSLFTFGQSVQSRTALHQSDNTYAFAMGPNGDLFAIKKSNTGTKLTEVHIITAGSGYQRFGLQTGTALAETDSSYDFVVADNADVIAIKKWGTGTGKTEIHVLTAASKYKSFGLQTGTALGPTDDGYVFGIGPNRDIYAIKRAGVNSTEVHILNAARNYQSFGLQTGTVLHKTDQSFSFLIAPNGDVLAIKRSGTGTKKTEVHVLTRASSYQSFGLQTGTALHEVGSNFAFAIVAPLRAIYRFRSRLRAMITAFACRPML